MNDQQTAKMHSCIFKGYIEETPSRDISGACEISLRGYEFSIHLISMKKNAGAEEGNFPLPKHFKIKAYCLASYKENEDDENLRMDRTLKESLMPSIHVGSLIEFRGTAYRNEKNKPRNVVIPQQIKTAHEIKMDRHYIRIMPPNKESVKRSADYVRVEKEKKKNKSNETGNGERKVGYLTG